MISSLSGLRLRFRRGLQRLLHGVAAGVEGPDELLLKAEDVADQGSGFLAESGQDRGERVLETPRPAQEIGLDRLGDPRLLICTES